MRTKLSEIDGRLVIHFIADELVERRFLSQLMEHGATIVLQNKNELYTNIEIKARLAEEVAFAEAMDEVLKKL